MFDKLNIFETLSYFRNTFANYGNQDGVWVDFVFLIVPEAMFRTW